jgi:hypothetical protein
VGPIYGKGLRIATLPTVYAAHQNGFRDPLYFEVFADLQSLCLNEEMKKFRLVHFVVLFSLGIYGLAEAQQPRVGRAKTGGPVGKEAAAEYFQKNPDSRETARDSDTDHYLALHFGKMMNSESWDWGGSGKLLDVGGNTYGLTYRFEEFTTTSDLNLRVDFIEYSINEDRPMKMSIMPLLIFPEAGSRFPIYFGFGLGAGVFFKQVRGSSALSLDYQLITGARFFDVFENTGFFIEAGLKNHLHLLSSGQLNSSFLTGGAVFTF